MEGFGKFIAKSKIVILIIGVLLLIPAGIGYVKTRVNYDVLYYLPKDIDTMKGQDILLDEFGKGAYAVVIEDGLTAKEANELEEKVKSVDHVSDIISYNDISHGNVPLEILPDKYAKKLHNASTDATMMIVFFDNTTSSDETMQAIKDVRTVTDKKCLVSGMSAVVTDTKTMALKETNIYVAVAVVLACAVLAFFMDSFLVPVFFMLSIGMAIIYNLGSNIIFGEISYITKALAAVLQLGVTLDYSIFLWHSYKEFKVQYPDDHDEAMALAIEATITSVVGSSITTVAGFIALCFMSFTLGLDLGLVMAKGVIFGVIGCVTILPAMILTFDRPLEKTMHREILPHRLDRLAAFIVNHSWIFIVLFIVLLFPAFYGYKHTGVYYDLSDTLPANLDCTIANKKLESDFDLNSMYMVLADKDLSPKASNEMMEDINKLDGITFAMSLDSMTGAQLPEEMIPADLKSKLKGSEHQIMVVGSDYKVASDNVNKQIDSVNEIAKKYDSSAMVIGEAPCTKDLITITDKDFKIVSAVSIAAIFLIIFFVLKSATLPLILVATIEFAIFINMGIPFYTHTTIPFIASVVIGTIQLGATVDYAILMTTRYKTERYSGESKKEAITTALSTSIPSIIVSALGFFAATFGVGLISSVDMIASLCTLMARGAIVSMFTVILVLPSFFVLFDKVIIHTSLGFIDKKNK